MAGNNNRARRGMTGMQGRTERVKKSYRQGRERQGRVNKAAKGRKERQARRIKTPLHHHHQPFSPRLPTVIRDFSLFYRGPGKRFSEATAAPVFLSRPFSFPCIGWTVIVWIGRDVSYLLHTLTFSYIKVRTSIMADPLTENSD